jgi:hypothetical protein
MSKRSKSILKKCIVIMLIVIITSVAVAVASSVGIISPTVADVLFPIITTGGSSFAVMAGIYPIAKNDVK